MLENDKKNKIINNRYSFEDIIMEDFKEDWLFYNENGRVELLINILKPYTHIVYSDLVDLSNMDYEEFVESVENVIGFDIETVIEWYENNLED
jgi:hypothetical protein